MADVFEEVEESLRQDRFQAIFRRYAPWGALALAVIVLLVGGREYFVSRSTTLAAQGADAYASATALIEAGEPDTARRRFAELAASRSDGYAALAKIREADLAFNIDGAGGGAHAGELFEEAAQLANDPILRDLALLKAALARADGIAFPALEARLAPLAEPGQPFEYAAREVLAAAAMTAGEIDRAREGYSFLSLADEVSPNQRARAERALAVLRAQLSTTREAEPE